MVWGGICLLVGLVVTLVGFAVVLLDFAVWWGASCGLCFTLDLLL